MIKIIKRKAKKCPYCSSLKTIKDGIRRDVKKPVMRYLCKECGKKFQSKHRKPKKIYQKYFLKNISEKRKTLLNYQKNII